MATMQMMAMCSTHLALDSRMGPPSAQAMWWAVDSTSLTDQYSSLRKALTLVS